MSRRGLCLTAEQAAELSRRPGYRLDAVGVEGCKASVETVAPPAGEQLAMKLGRRRKDTMTAEELRGLRLEAEIRAETLNALTSLSADVAWAVRCEPYSGFVLPYRLLRVFEARLRKEVPAHADAVLRILRSLIAWREFGSVGMSDIIGQLRPAGGRVGALLAAEVKRPGLEPDDHQRAFLELVAANGGCAVCTHSGREAVEKVMAFRRAFPGRE